MHRLKHTYSTKHADFLVVHAISDKTSEGVRLQSAMEYLMTYGWAILVIAIVLAALFQLGVFNSANFAPKAPPGSCQVFRPNGPGTTTSIDLEGMCNGMLPRYVALFNGGSSAVTTQLYRNVTGGGWTEGGWVDVSGDSTGYCGAHSNVLLNDRGSGAGNSLTLGTGPSSSGGFSFFFGWDSNGIGSFATSNSIYQYNHWYFIVGTYNSSYGFSLYVNGKPVAYYTNSGSHSGTTCTDGALPTHFDSSFPWVIGYENSWNSYFDGSIANVQVYNTAIPANNIEILYREGIGGAPMNIQNLVAWWPLNGNANDYSGNDKNGVPNGVSYSTSWTLGYTPP
jgi:hypothetical protein